MANDDTPSEKSSPPLDPTAARKELVRALVLCVLAVVLVRSFVFELFKIPSSSMVPTLQIGDHIVVSKYNFGLFFPFSDWQLVSWGAPKRGEVIVFVYPKDQELYYIKRVIGLPGDTVEYQGRKLWVNGEEIQKEKVTNEMELKAVLGEKPAGELYKENLGNVVHYVKHSKISSYDLSNEKESHTVQPDHFFVMGDNRDDSYDSRSWGDVPEHNIRGKAQVIWLSLDQNANWGGGGKVRWGRAMTVIH